MSASCDLTDKTEKETLINQKKWLCSWTKNIIEQFDSFYNSVKIVSDGISQYDSKLAPIKVLLNGALRNIQNEFTDDEENILDAIKKTLVEFKDECNDKKPIPVYSYANDGLYSLLGITGDEINTTKVITVEGNYNYFSGKNGHLCYRELCKYIDDNFNERFKKYILIFNFESEEEMELFRHRTYTVFDNLDKSDKRVTVSVLNALRKEFSGIEIDFYYIPKIYAKYEPNEGA